MVTNVLDYLEETAGCFPDKVALVDDNSSITFSQWLQKAESIGTAICGIASGAVRRPVLVFVDRRIEGLVGFMGVVKSGNFYVPIDCKMPDERLKLIVDILNPIVAITVTDTENNILDSIGFEGKRLMYRDVAESCIDDEQLKKVRSRMIDLDPLYAIFTSGSTGVPKGVVACHRSVIDYIENLSEVLCFNENTRFANQTPLYFDACLKELYPTLKFGATTYIVPKSLFMFPIKLVEFLNEYKINTVCWVVSALTMISAFKTFNKIKPEYLHTIAFGSEVFPIKQLKIWRETLPKARFVNLYGPTEATGMCCYFEVDREFELDEVVPIGRPFHNTEILLLDENNKLVEDGNVGEICVRGTSLTLGYYNNFEKTSEVFVQNPLNSRYPELIYKTGDLGKRNERGELIFVSRKDYQIKHMGHRIELGEIEVNVNMIEEISTSCAVYDKEKGKIVLYYIGELEPDKLVRLLKDKLPRYMIPNKTEKLEQMPLTANGKIDRVFLMKKAQER